MTIDKHLLRGESEASGGRLPIFFYPGVKVWGWMCYLCYGNGPGATREHAMGEHYVHLTLKHSEAETRRYLDEIFEHTTHLVTDGVNYWRGES